MKKITSAFITLTVVIIAMVCMPALANAQETTAASNTTVTETTTTATETTTQATVTTPAKVEGLKLSKSYVDSIKISWNAVSGASGYTIYKYADSSWQVVANVSSSNTSYTVTGLESATKYSIKVAAYTTYNSQNYYGSKSDVLKAPTKPNAVTKVKQTASTTTSVTLKWSKVSGASGYYIYQYKNDEWVQVKNVSDGSTVSAKVKNLSAGKAYKFKVAAYKKADSYYAVGKKSSSISTSTCPKAVTIGEQVNVSTTSVTISWKKQKNATGYVIYRLKGEKWVKVATVKDADTTQYKISKLSKNTKYKFRVRAYKKTKSYTSYGSYSKSLTTRTGVSKKTVGKTYLMSEAQWDSKKLTSIPKGSKVIKFGSSGRWFKVKYGSQIGYIYNKALGSYKNYSTVSKKTLPIIADDTIYKYNCSLKSIYSYVRSIGYRKASNDTTENLCVYILKYGRGACYHHAAWLYYLYDRMGYETLVVNGIDKYTGGGPHAWVMIKYQGKWRHVDPTSIRGLSQFYMVKDSTISPYFKWDRDKYPAAK